MNILRTFIIVILLWAPIRAAAEQATRWNLTATEGGTWNISTALNPQITEEGFVLRALERGKLTRAPNTGHSFDAISITYTASKNIDVDILWHVQGMAIDELIAAPIVLYPSDEPVTRDIDLSLYDQWNGTTEKIGFSFDAGTEITIHAIEVKGWSRLEKLWEVWKTFWTFDFMRPSSINYLWGPLIATNPVARAQLFYSDPPIAYSANWIFYVILLVGVVASLRFVHRKFQGVHAHRLLMIIAVLWLVYDLRMGSEFLSYLKKDYDNYWTQPIGVRTLRDRGYVYDFAKAVHHLIEDRDRYIFMADRPWPFVSIIAYETYPKAPTVPTEAGIVDTWAIYKRPDIMVNEKGHLVIESIEVPAEGTVLHEFEPGTFVYRTLE